MAVEQLPGQVREFAGYLNGLLARLDQGAGWCGVFWQRDPDGMRACLDGYEVPPWDVVEALLQDLAAGYGSGAVTPEAERARALHQASLAAFDSRPGARDTLGDRLDVMLREQKYAAERLAELGRSLGSAASHEEAESLRLDLAWARDDHERASARCVELRYRLDQLARWTVSRAPFRRLDRDDEADVFANRVHNAPHLADAPDGDPLTLPRQRTDTEDTADRYDDERDARRQRTDSRPAAGYGNGSGSRRKAPDDPAPARYGDDRDAGRQGSGDRTAVWREGTGRSDRTDDRDAARPTAYGDGRGPGREDADGEASAWHAGSRRSGRTDDRDAAYGDDRGPGRHSPDDEASAWRDGAHQPDAPSTPEPSAERAAPRLPTDWYEPPAAGPDPEPAPADPRPAPKQRSKRRARGGARFAGMMDDADTGATPVVDPTPVPPVPGPAAPSRRTPRGARFAGAAARSAAAVPVREALDDDARHDTIDAVRNLVRLRGEGRSGEAHALLVEASHWPAARFPLLAAELNRAGLGADWATLLWEAASLPADRLVAAADALVAAGRETDGRQILRQGIVRPAQEVGEAVLRLAEEGKQREVRALLDAYVRVRTPEEAVRSVAADPQRLVPLLLEAARGASEDRYWDLVHALRVAGHSA
ncbi:hypothetical protein GCM10023084_39430 [Streptomyces lacrimifluminis]|uniref:UL36 very large tegument protein n=1 Tax=Streptomyces lacrimifluminis TaxID=1500077 RepID=A0A917NY83_9ACTN|nr:hypothetical protein [Streptomyces lacrimifluminis]GGJ40165.1 hypothetical protein GCM10012282_41050 [Streptomyces lacrimifluminis]